MRMGDRIAKELPRVGGTVDGEKKHIALLTRLKQGCIKELWMPKPGAFRVRGYKSRSVLTDSSDLKVSRMEFA